MKIIPVKTTDKDYPYVHNIWISSFPDNERRPELKQHHTTDNNKLFTNCVVADSEDKVGMISFWTFNDFRYIEHFAIDPQKRNGGYGGKTIEAITAISALPIVLEVELPETKDAKRQIGRASCRERVYVPV